MFGRLELPDDAAGEHLIAGRGVAFTMSATVRTVSVTYASYRGLSRRADNVADNTRRSNRRHPTNRPVSAGQPPPRHPHHQKSAAAPAAAIAHQAPGAQIRPWGERISTTAHTTTA